MDIDNCYKNIFNVSTIEKLELSINYKLKKIGYIYFLNCIERFSKIETTEKNIQILSDYIFEYIKLYIVDNKYKFGKSEFIKNLKLNNKSIIIEKMISERLNSDQLIKLMDGFLLDKQYIINIFLLIEDNDKILNNISQSQYWFMDNSVNNMNNTYVGKLINCKHNKYLITNTILNNLICEWVFKLVKLGDFDENPTIYINILSFFWKMLNIKSNQYIKYIDNIEYDSNNIEKNIFYICYKFFKIGIINNILQYFELKKNIKYIDNKLINIYSNNKINNIKRIQIISENQIIKNNMKKHKKILETILNEKKEIITKYCTFISSLILEDIITNSSLSIISNKYFIKEYCSNLIYILKFYNINDKTIYNFIFDLLKSSEDLDIEIVCIEYIVNYIQIYSIDIIDKNILNKLFDIFIKLNETKLTKYELYEPRYYILYIYKYINKYIFNIDDYILINIDKFNNYIKFILNDLSELFYEIIFYFDKLSNIYILSNDNNDESNNIINILETFTTFFNEYIEQLYLLSNNNKIICQFDKYVYNKICNILFHNIKKIVSNLDTYIYIIDLYNINFNLLDFLIKIILIIFNFNKNDELLLDFYKLEFDYKILNDIKCALFHNNIISWTIYYKIVELQINYNKYIIENKQQLNINSKFLDPLLCTEITNPVILPNSNIILNFETIKQHLENSQTDPFDRTILTMEIIIDYNEQKHIKDIISKFIQEKNENYK